MIANHRNRERVFPVPPEHEQRQQCDHSHREDANEWVFLASVHRNHLLCTALGRSRLRLIKPCEFWSATINRTSWKPFVYC